MNKCIRRDKCPICDSLLVQYGVSEVFGACFSWNKTTYSKCAQSVLLMKRGCYELENHFKVEAHDDIPYHETYILHPYIIESYSYISNIYIYEKNSGVKHFVAETPYLDLQWSNEEKTLKKLKLYTLFS
jgi:hypothetical protein